MRFSNAETARGFAIRLKRPGLWIVVWLLVEIALASLLARQIGWGFTLLALLGKSGFGFLFLLFVTGRAMGKVAAGPNLLMHVQRIGFGLVSGLILIAPGFLASFLALAMLAPGLRNWLLNQSLKPANNGDPDGVVTLKPDEWRDVTPDPAAIEPDIRQRP